MIIADRLVHASIIDGIRLSGARFTRFPHNDFDRLERAIAAVPDDADRILVIVESVYSMDGDRADIDRLIDHAGDLLACSLNMALHPGMTFAQAEGLG